jgi:protein-S-isoprenylcysteine O-methyltransferase Ste14
MLARLNGWGWVVTQVTLLLVLLFAPLLGPISGYHSLRIVAILLVALGLAISFIASRNLGTALTPTPVPRSQATLHTNGIYKYVRHPIYTAILLAATGIALYRLAWSSIVLCVGVYLFFYFKSKHEEKLLKSKYSEYKKYQDSTGRFFPKPGQENGN